MHIKKSAADDTDALISALQSADEQVRISAIDRLGRRRDEDTVRALMDFALHADNWRDRNRAIRLLGDIGDPRSPDVLIKIFGDPFLNGECPSIKWNTALALGNFKNDSRVVNILINAVNDKSLMVREAVIQSLGRIGNAEAVPFLIPALKDRSFAIRFSAVRALEKIGDSGAIPFLKKAVDNDSDLFIKNAAISALKVFNTVYP